MSETNKTVHLIGADLDLVLEQKPRRQRTRKPRIDALIKRAEKAGKQVSSITTDGVTLTFGETASGGPEAENMNPWDEVLSNVKN